MAVRGPEILCSWLFVDQKFRAHGCSWTRNSVLMAVRGPQNSVLMAVCGPEIPCSWLFVGQKFRVHGCSWARNSVFMAVRGQEIPCSWLFVGKKFRARGITSGPEIQCSWLFVVQKFRAHGCSWTRNSVLMAVRGPEIPCSWLFVGQKFRVHGCSWARNSVFMAVRGQEIPCSWLFVGKKFRARGITSGPEIQCSWLFVVQKFRVHGCSWARNSVFMAVCGPEILWSWALARNFWPTMSEKGKYDGRMCYGQDNQQEQSSYSTSNQLCEAIFTSVPEGNSERCFSYCEFGHWSISPICPNNSKPAGPTLQCNWMSFYRITFNRVIRHYHKEKFPSYLANNVRSLLKLVKALSSEKVKMSDDSLIRRAQNLLTELVGHL
ncbi:predicted protein [Nematostella vectensis]|uniref:Uncharacterized protein n=1 Tax=Nematostella vectensis TaxID=45351 RepID=A7SSV5_NEMVE|nr:predicted protein [Nematostella vectensis]|eukprot:XP_001625320.1 predicted protein [Nematostella vectensis]